MMKSESKEDDARERWKQISSKQEQLDKALRQRAKQLGAAKVAILSSFSLKDEDLRLALKVFYLKGNSAGE